MLAHLRNPRLLATYAVGFGVLFNFIATFTYLSFHLAAPPFNRSPAFLGSIFVVYLVGSAAALWLGRAIAWLGRRTFVLCVLAVWAAGMLFSLLPSVTAIVFTLVIASTCGILTQASSTSFVAITAKTGTSAAVGLYVTSFYVGGTFGGWLPALAYEAGGWPYSLALVLGMLSIMAVIVATILEAVEFEIDDHATETKRPARNQPGVQHAAAEARHLPDQSRQRLRDVATSTAGSTSPGPTRWRWPSSPTRWSSRRWCRWRAGRAGAARPIRRGRASRPTPGPPASPPRREAPA